MLAFLGGTGPEGKGLAARLAMAGEEIIIGSRDAARGAEAAQELLRLVPGSRIKAEVNFEAAKQADVIFLTVPYEAQSSLLGELRSILTGKILVNVIAPMRFQRGRGASALPVGTGSASEEAHQLLPDSTIVSAFHTVSAVKLGELDKEMEGDVIVCSDDPESKAFVMNLVRKIPNLRPVDGGALANSRYVEQITPLLVNINRIYKIQAGIKITGLNPPS